MRRSGEESVNLGLGGEWKGGNKPNWAVLIFFALVLGLLVSPVLFAPVLIFWSWFTALSASRERVFPKLSAHLLPFLGEETVPAKEGKGGS